MLQGRVKLFPLAYLLMKRPLLCSKCLMYGLYNTINKTNNNNTQLVTHPMSAQYESSHVISCREIDGKDGCLEMFLEDGE
jgi:hypothetical protein